MDIVHIVPKRNHHRPKYCKTLVKRRFVNHYFLCDITGVSEQNLTAVEKERGLTPEWIEPEKMLEIYSKYNDHAATNEDKSGAYLREYTALTEYFKMFG